MAKKGVKKIVWNGEGTVYKDKSVPGRSIVIAGGTTVGFKVGEWFPDTTEAEKNKQVTWFRQSHDKKVDYFKDTRPSNKPYTLFISKAQAGKVGFYIEASLTGYKDLSGETGMYVRAYSPPRVVSSYWKEDIEGNNNQIYSGNPTQYNVPLHLHLELEGLNGYNCTVHIYNCEFNLFGDNNQKISKTYTAKCSGGDLDIYIPAGDVLQWRKEIGAEKPLEQFYIQLSVDGAKGYVKDNTPKGDLKHATHLFIKNSFGKILTKVIPLPKGNKVITIGEEEKKPIKYDLCTFSKINIHDREKLKTVFSNTDPRTMGIAEDKFTFSLNIFYDTDQYEVPAVSKAILKNIIKYLKQNPQISVTIESYADIRNTYDYNDNLTEKRANAILSFFYTNGIKNPLKAFGYGERRAKQFDYITNEDRPIHKINRKTVLTFKVNNLKTVFYNTITPNYEEPVDLSIFVKDIQNSACLSLENGKPQHDLKKITYSELVNYNGDRSVIKDIPLIGEEGKLKIFSFEGDMFPSALGLKPNRYELGIHSCAYFPNPKKTTLVVNAFTDALWILQATYDFEGDYPIVYRNKPESISVIKGIKQLAERGKFYIDKYMSVIKYFPMGSSYETMVNLAFDYFVSEAEMYGIGYAKKWNYVGGKFSKIQNYTDANRDLVEKGILTLTVLVMVVELIIAVLTMGESAAAKLPKLKKAIRLLKKVEEVKKEVGDLGFDFIFPKVAFTYGTYLEKYKDLVHYVTEFNVKAEPVIGIKFDKMLSLKDLIQRTLTKEKVTNKEGKEEYEYNDDFKDLKREKIDDKDPLKNNFEKASRNFAKKQAEGQMGEGLQNLLDKAGVDAKIRLMFSGSINQEYKIKISSPAPHEQFAGKVNIANTLKQSFSNSAGKVIGENAIKMEGQLMAKGRIQLVNCVPFVPFSVSNFLGRFVAPIDAKLQASLESHFVHTRTYGANEAEGLFYQDEIYFSGIKGIIKLSLTKENRNSSKSLDDNHTSKPIDTEFHLFKDKTFLMAKINLFYKNNN